MEDLCTQHGFRRLPNEMISSVLDHLDLEAAARLLRALCLAPAVQQAFLRVRQNPVRYLRSLCSHPAQLLRIMHQTRSVLALSRAVNFFAPGLCAADADWNFIQDFSPDQELARRFIALTGKLGFRWGQAEPRIDFPNVSRYEGTVQHGHTQHRIVLEIRDCFTACEMIMDFHISPTRCFIAGTAAVHLYGHDLFRQRMFVWIVQAQLYARTQTLKAKQLCRVCSTFRAASRSLPLKDFRALQTAYKPSLRCPVRVHAVPISPPDSRLQDPSPSLEAYRRKILHVPHTCKGYVSFPAHVEKYVNAGYLFDPNDYVQAQAARFDVRRIGDAHCCIIPFDVYSNVCHSAVAQRALRDWRDNEWWDTGALSLIMPRNADGANNINAVFSIAESDL